MWLDVLGEDASLSADKKHLSQVKVRSSIPRPYSVTSEVDFGTTSRDCIKRKHSDEHICSSLGVQKR